MKAFRLLKKIPISEVAAGIVLHYLIGDELDKIKEMAWLEAWWRILLCCKYDQYENDYSESEGSEFSLTDFDIQPLFMLALARGPPHIRALRYSCGRPFQILTLMLGCPPLGLGVHRAIKDSWLQSRFLISNCTFDGLS